MLTQHDIDDRPTRQGYLASRRQLKERKALALLRHVHVTRGHDTRPTDLRDAVIGELQKKGESNESISTEAKH